MEGLIWIHEHMHSSDVFNQIVKCITFLGNAGIFWIVLAVILFCNKKTRIASLMMMVSLLVGYIFNDFVLKNIFARPRPFVEYEEFASYLNNINLDLPSGYSFPSGHAYSSFNCAVILMLFNKKLGILTIPTALAIALSRILLCVHYPTDVLAGAILGILTAVLVYYTYKLICRKVINKRRQQMRVNN